ncbi:hypothetical protein HF086_013553 [Spodoptera exigua]|uniref:Uncharacterized protein n=1 Tax=Spodoptera exigua TaxID=7107 RepID=A0A922SLS0_SPOEX|nr:hypothetical protein HF086_013553 [Spodoptera exigua]
MRDNGLLVFKGDANNDKLQNPEDIEKAEDEKPAPDKATVLQKVRTQEMGINTGRDLSNSNAPTVIDRRTSFVCCSLQYTTFDLYQGLDPSFESSLSTDSSEKTTTMSSYKKRMREKKKRRNERNKRKRKIKESIIRIVKEIKKTLHKAYQNATATRKKKTRELRKLIKYIKKQYIKDRQSVAHVHELDIAKVDERLQKNLNQIKGFNEKFLANETFREILVNGTAKGHLKEFLRTHPKLRKIITQRRQDGGLLEPVPDDKSSADVQYDMEYGVLYY